MNLDGPQPMKQDIRQLTQAINEMTVYKPDRPTDLFQFYHPEIRKHFVDAYNLCRIWVEGLLYWKGLYPEKAFEMKTAYAKKVFIVKSKILREYLDKFFESVCQNFQFVDFIQVQIYEEREKHGMNGMKSMKLVEKQKFYFSFTDKFAKTEKIQEIKRKGLNTIQKEMQYKRFLGKMQEEMKNGYSFKQDKKYTYRLYMGYKWDHKGKNNKHRMNLLQKWTETDPQETILFQSKTVNHAGTGELELICERYTPLGQSARIQVE